MKALHYLLLTLLVSQYLSQTPFCTEVKNPTKKEDCNSASVEFQNIKLYRCCYLHMNVTALGQTTDTKICIPATKAIYDEVSTLSNMMKKSAEEINAQLYSFEINCDSKYLVIPILSILLFLLL